MYVYTHSEWIYAWRYCPFESLKRIFTLIFAVFFPSIISAVRQKLILNHKSKLKSHKSKVTSQNETSNYYQRTQIKIFLIVFFKQYNTGRKSLTWFFAIRHC